MISLNITVKDNASVGVQAVTDVLANPTPLHQAGGQAIVVSLQKHFLQRNSQPNKKGWTKKNFWLREGRGRTALVSADDNGAVVGVSSPAIAHKLRGGTIVPKRGKYLAIPLTAAAYAAGSPREGAIEGMFFLKRPGRNPLLVTKDGKSVRAQYVLLKSVTHAADPETLPPLASLEADAGKAIDGFLRRLVARSSN